MQRTHFVTGATGFVGSALVLELLRDRACRVVCIARGNDAEGHAQRRVWRALRRAAEASEEAALLEHALSRIEVLAQDLREPLAAEGSGPLSSLGADTRPEFWHVAASLRFEDAYAQEILEHNVGGTRNVVELARRMGAGAFNYVSTAYVAGARRGHILEELAPLDARVNNAYERSKILAEHCVADSGLRHRILRPSIVIGFSKTGSAAGSESGFYGYVQRLLRLKRLLERRGRKRAFADTFLPGDPGAALDMIPVDVVARNAIAIARSASQSRIFHLTNAAPPDLGTVADTLSELLELGGPRFRRSARPSGPYAHRLGEQMQFFLAYLTGGKTFDRRNTDAAIGAEASLWPLDSEGTRRYLDRFLEEQRELREDPTD